MATAPILFDGYSNSMSIRQLKIKKKRRPWISTLGKVIRKVMFQVEMEHKWKEIS